MSRLYADDRRGVRGRLMDVIHAASTPAPLRGADLGRSERAPRVSTRGYMPAPLRGDKPPRQAPGLRQALRGDEPPRQAPGLRQALRGDEPPRQAPGLRQALRGDEPPRQAPGLRQTLRGDEPPRQAPGLRQALRSDELHTKCRGSDRPSGAMSLHAKRRGSDRPSGAMSSTPSAEAPTDLHLTDFRRRRLFGGIGPLPQARTARRRKGACPRPNPARQRRFDYVETFL